MWGERRYAWKIATQYFPEAQYFLWLEPEKADLMTKASIDAILDPMRNWEADIVVPSRKSKVTLPPQQKSAENRANRRANYTIENKWVFNNNSFRDRYVFRAFPSDKDDPIDLDKIYADNETSDNTDWHDQWEIDATWKMNAPYDLWFWPKAFTRQSMEQDFLSYKWAKWDSIITSVLAWKLRWKNVVDVPVDFSYPPEQSALEQDSLHAEDYAKKRRIQYRYIMKTIRKLVESATE